MKCQICDGTGWVCENHSDRPSKVFSDRNDACGCGAAQQCLVCNQGNRKEPPKMPPGRRPSIRTGIDTKLDGCLEPPPCVRFCSHLMLWIDFAMDPKRINNPILNDHAMGIGYLCFMYNGLEARVNNLLGLLANLQDEDLELFTNQIDLFKKLPTLKALAFKNQQSRLWYDDIELMIWAIEKQIIPLRNRYVHDVWLALPSGAARRYERIRIAKPQSRQAEFLTTHEHIHTTGDQIWQLVQETKDVSNILRHLHAAHKSGRAKTHPEESFPSQYRDRWRARRTPPKGPNAKASL